MLLKVSENSSTLKSQKSNFISMMPKVKMCLNQINLIALITLPKSIFIEKEVFVAGKYFPEKEIGTSGNQRCLPTEYSYRTTDARCQHPINNISSLSPQTAMREY